MSPVLRDVISVSTRPNYQPSSITSSKYLVWKSWQKILFVVRIHYSDQATNVTHLSTIDVVGIIKEAGELGSITSQKFNKTVSLLFDLSTKFNSSNRSRVNAS